MNEHLRRSPANPPGSPSRSHGFTLVEAMVVIAILAVLAAIAAPSFQRVVQRYQVRHAMGDFTAALYLARSEAIKRGGRVTMAKAAAAGCTAAGAKEWHCGWNVFVDANENGALDDGEELLQASGLPRGAFVCVNTGVSLKFSGWGDLVGPTSTTVRMRPFDDSDDVLGLGLATAMSAAGRLKTDAAGPGEVKECT